MHSASNALKIMLVFFGLRPYPTALLRQALSLPIWEEDAGILFCRSTSFETNSSVVCGQTEMTMTSQVKHTIFLISLVFEAKLQFLCCIEVVVLMLYATNLTF